MEFAEYWQDHEPSVAALLASEEDPDDLLVVIRMICENAWLKSDVQRRQEMLAMAESFNAERQASVKYMHTISSALDSLIVIAEGLARKNETEQSNNDGSG